MTAERLTDEECDEMWLTALEADVCDIAVERAKITDEQVDHLLRHHRTFARLSYSRGLQRAAEIARNVRNGYTASVFTCSANPAERSTTMIRDKDGPWVLNSDVASAIDREREEGPACDHSNGKCSGPAVGCYGDERKETPHGGEERKRMSKLMISKPIACTNEHLTYLDELLDSGETDLYGACLYLRYEFSNLTRREALNVLLYWQKTFTERHPR